MPNAKSFVVSVIGFIIGKPKLAPGCGGISTSAYEAEGELLKRYNRKFRENYRIPHEHIVVGRVKDLVHPENKMSKSSPEGLRAVTPKSGKIYPNMEKI